MFPSQVGERLLEVARVTVGARVQRARGEVEVGAVRVDLRFGLMYGLVLHFFAWVKVKGKDGFTCRDSKRFLRG